MTEPDEPTMDRVTTFTDGVVAIAMTLLILPLAEIEPAQGEGAVHLLRANGAPIGAFALSFVVIANYWSSHHDIFRSVERHDTRLVQLNTVWLASIVWLPFPTALISRDIDGGYGTLYVASLLVVSLLTLAIVLHLGRHAELLSAAGALGFDRHRRSCIAAVLALVAALAISFFSQRYGIWSLLLLVPAQIVAGRLRPRRSAPAQSAPADRPPHGSPPSR